MLAARVVTLALAYAAAVAASSAGPDRAPAPVPTFRDIARSAGLDFVHVNGASQQRFLPEVLGPGGLFLDVDNDGWLDVLLVDGGSIADPGVAGRAHDRLYRNRGNGTFEDITSRSTIGRRGYGMGACAGDYDNDGLIDVYITNVGPNQLYHNDGQGRFTEVPNAAGAAGQLWSTSCAFVDIDRDGDLDLFVANYVDAGSGRNPFCGIEGPPPVRDYCHPLMYPPLHSTLYRNNGGKSFEDISTSSGVAGLRGNGLGVAVADVNSDGWPDVFVANDAMPNFLLRNNTDGTFTDVAGLAGVAVTADGKAKAGMGTAFGDFAGTGRLGLIVTNHEAEMHSLFLGIGDTLFSDVTLRSGVGLATRPYVGFGVAFFDADNDGDLDVAIANGHVMANASLLRGGGTFAQRNLLLRNSGGRFENVTDHAGPGFSTTLVSRALAAGDIDNDGDLDLLVTNNGAGVSLLLNEGSAGRTDAASAEPGNALLIRVIGAVSNRSGIGTRLTLTAGGRRQVREVQSGSSYLSQNDLRAHFGLGAASRADRLQITWPNGATELIENVPANRVITIREGKGVVDTTPFRR